MRKERPGLRLQQYEEIIYKVSLDPCGRWAGVRKLNLSDDVQEFKKSPENPFNQATVAFDATKEEKVEALRKLREETETRCDGPTQSAHTQLMTMFVDCETFSLSCLLPCKTCSADLLLIVRYNN